MKSTICIIALLLCINVCKAGDTNGGSSGDDWKHFPSQPPTNFWTNVFTLFSIINQETNADIGTNNDLPSIEFPTNWAQLTNLVWSANVLPELAEQFNWNKDEDVVSDFDRQICASLHLPPKPPTLISFKEMSMVFHYPNQNPLVPDQEKDEVKGWPDLIYDGGIVSRTNIDDEVLTKDARFYDPKAKGLWVKIDLLLNIAPLEKPNEGKDVRRSFVYVWHNKWVKD